jgi:hypothetical protein
MSPDAGSVFVWQVSVQSQLSATPHQSMAIVTADYKGPDYFAQLKYARARARSLSHTHTFSLSLSLSF